MSPGLGWAAESAPAGGLDAVSKLIEQRMQMARDAEVVRSNMAREQQAADALKENTAYRHDVFGAAQATRDLSAGEALGKTLSPGADVTDIAPTLNKGMQGPNMSAPAYAPMPIPAPPAGIADPTQDPNAPDPAATGGGPYVPNSPSLDSPNVTKRITWLGTPAEREVKRKKDDAAAYVRGLPPGEDRSNAEYQEALGHPKPPNRGDLEADRQANRIEMANLTAGLRQGGTSRVDHSYDTQTKRLDTMEKPIADQAERIARLRITLDQGNPLADTLIAPELLIAMAGGQGSGLRINEAEISRVVGGKNNFEKLKSALGKFQLNPDAPFDVNPDMRRQMRDLIKVIADRGQQRLKLIDDARAQLLDATDVVGHRRAMDVLKKALNSDGGAGAAAAPGASDADGWVDVGGVRVRRKPQP